MTSTGNSYADQNYLNGGVLLIAGNGSLGAVASGMAVNLNGGTLAANGTFALDNAGANLRPVNLLGSGGGLAATAGNILTVDGVIGSAANTGPLVIGIPASSANNNTAGLLPGTGTGTVNAAVYATGTVVLTNANYFTGGTLLPSGTLKINGINALGGANYGGLTFNGGTLQYSTNSNGNNGSADLTSIGTAGVTLAAGGGTVDVNGNNITYAGSIGNGGSGALTVKSSLANGVLTLQGANTYAGNTTITNVTVLANNTGGSAAGSGNVTVQNGGTLAGAGALDGSVTVTAGGTLAPGNPLGTLSLGNNLTLATGSKTFVQVQHSPLTNDAVIIAGALTEGGTLVVTNSGVIAFSAGDSFNLFNAAGSYAGSFSTISLPSLNPGLFWSTSRLAVDGTIGVVSTNPPVVSSASQSGGYLVLQGSGGTPDWSYTILSSTNLTLPLAQWTTTATNFFDASGNFTWTNTDGANGSRQFFVLKVQ
jgi:autotransporter-associated beta strand protein